MCNKPAKKYHKWIFMLIVSVHLQWLKHSLYLKVCRGVTC